MTSLAALARYLAVPLQAAPIMLIAMASVLISFSTYGGVVGWPLALIVMAWFFKYAFALLDAVTDGAKEPPVLSIEMLNPVSEQRSFVLLIIVIGIFFASDAASYWFGAMFGALLGLAIVFVLPAMIAVQGATGSLLQSLNLQRCIRLIVRLGNDYFVIIACAGALLVTAVLIMRMSWLPLFLRLGVSLYAWLALFALIGGILFERRDDIGLDAAHSPERVDARAAAELDQQRNRLLDRIYAEWRGGSHITACNTVTELLRQSPAPAHELEWLYGKTREWPDVRLASQLAQAWLPYLFEMKQSGRVLDVLRERLAKDANFRPATSQQVLRCVRLARDGGERRIARQLLQDFAVRFPDDSLGAVAADLRAELER